MKRIITVTACFATLLLMSFALTRDETRYKNLKVMPKNTNKYQMDSVMHHFTNALGVRCNYCHVYNQEQKSMDFASDNNDHKKTARDMMRMTNRINRKYFDVKKSSRMDARLEVTCFSCHHGSAEVAKKGMGGEMRGQERKPMPTDRRNPADSTAKPMQ